MTFAEEIKDHKERLEGARESYTSCFYGLRECFERRIMELESDLQIARDDLENQTALTQTLKDKLEERKP